MELNEVFAKLSTKEDVLNFLKDLCTPKELRDLNERWEVCKLLHEKNLSYRQIKEKTKASLTTIGRVARFLKDESNNGYLHVLLNLK